MLLTRSFVRNSVPAGISLSSNPRKELLLVALRLDSSIQTIPNGLKANGRILVPEGEVALEAAFWGRRPTGFGNAGEAYVMTNTYVSVRRLHTLARLEILA